MKLLGFREKNFGGQRFFFLPSLEAMGVLHGFSTRLSVPLPQLFDKAPYILMDQKHSDMVHLITDGQRPKIGDGLVILEREVFGLVKTADCLPIIMADPTIPVVAIVHAGWRGTLKRITRKTLGLLRECGAQRVTVLLGPAIAACCYEVGEEVYHLFQSAGFSHGIFERKEGKIFLDLKKANLFQLDDLCEVYDLSLCTYCETGFLSSARRGQKSSQINFVCLRQ